MSFASFDRRLRKLEDVIGSDDPRRFLHRPVCEWPDEVIKRVLQMSDAEVKALEDEMPPAHIDARSRLSA